MIRRHPASVMIIAVAGALLASACGSTAQLRTSAGGAGQIPQSGVGSGGGFGGQNGQAPANQGSSQESNGGTDLPGVGAPTGTQARGAADTAAPAANSRGGNPSTTLDGPAGPGVTRDAITVGITYVTNANASRAALGANGISSGDARANWDVILRDVNRHGGISGRQVKAVFHPYDSNSAEPTDSQQEAACQDFTTDHKVFAVLGGGSQDSFKSCLDKAGVVQEAEAIGFADTEVFRQHPYYVEPATMSLDRIASVEVAALNQQGYFAANSKLGIVTFDYAPFAHAVSRTLLPALRNVGVQHPQVASLHYPQQSSDLGDLASQISSTVLSFKTAGIDRVVFLGLATVPLLFLNNAESQSYHPKYGFNTQDAVQVLLASGDIPKAQVQGAVGVGWWPLTDLSRADNPIAAGNSARRRCVGLLNDNGITFADTNAEAVAVSECDMIWFLKAALERTAGTPSRQLFRQGVEGLGSTFVDGNTMGSSFSPTRHDGVAKTKLWGYHDDCTCFRYQGGVRSV